MPYFDGTGPKGQGAMTGVGRGNCGRGMGFGRGFRSWFSPTKTKVQEDLIQYKKNLEDELLQVNIELAKLEKEDE
jgi:hypothetical protein